MEEDRTGESSPEEDRGKHAEPPTARPPGTPPAGPAGTGTPHRRQNWILIALIAVSCAAFLLLVSTITLAAVGDFGGRKTDPVFERHGFRGMEPRFGPESGPDSRPRGPLSEEEMEERRRLREERRRDRMECDGDCDCGHAEPGSEQDPEGASPDTVRLRRNEQAS